MAVPWSVWTCDHPRRTVAVVPLGSKEAAQTTRDRWPEALIRGPFRERIREVVRGAARANAVNAVSAVWWVTR